MKLKTLSMLTIAAVIPAMMSAKKPKTAAAEEAPAQEQVANDAEDPVITEECVVNVSLFHEAVKNKQFDDAWDTWYETYSNCPNANKSIYTDGAKILEYKYKNAATDEERDRYRKLAIEIHDKRIRFFGNDPKYPTAYILGEKGVDYCQYYPDQAVNAYEWLKTSVEQRAQASKLEVLVTFFKVSGLKYKADPSFSEQFITDYTLVIGLLGQIADNPLNKNAAAAATNLDQINTQFAASGAADCDKLDELYGETVEKSLDNLEVLGKIVRLYKRIGCTDSEVYFSASAASHKLQPTEESAIGCAKMCIKRGDYRKAIDYYMEAYQLDIDANDDDYDESDYLFGAAYIYMDKLHNYAEARTYARRSMTVLNSDAPARLRSRALILIGLCYASTKPYDADDYGPKAPILNKTVFWAAVDKFQQAKRIDPACAPEADKLIATYSKYFPTKENRFDLPNEFSGTTFIVGGWINEETTIR